jgi:uncharacterized protein
VASPGEWTRCEVRDGMDITWHQPITVDDGTVLDADVFRPPGSGRHPVILSYGIYAKGVSFQGEIYGMQWDKLVAKDPSVLDGSSNKYQAWEVVDPERWVPEGYAVVRVDARGTGWSPGFFDPRSAREQQDACQCVEWAGRQPWSNGKVAIVGISYYAVMAWFVAARQPRHLAAIIAWEGFNNYYHATRHGGIRSEFQDRWFATQVARVQYGVGERGPFNENTGEPAAGPVTLSEEQLEANRIDLVGELKRRELCDEWYRERIADLSRIDVPLLTAANWGGQGIHPTGNFNGFMHAASEQKWLEVHGDTHWTHFYSAYGRDVQKRFFDHFLKGEDNGWDRQPPVQAESREVEPDACVVGDEPEVTGECDAQSCPDGMAVDGRDDGDGHVADGEEAVVEGTHRGGRVEAFVAGASGKVLEHVEVSAGREGRGRPGDHDRP